MRQWKWLHNLDVDDAHPVYEVRNNPVRIRAHGLGTNDVVQIEVLVGPSPAGTAGDDHQWVPLVRCGEPVVLNAAHNAFVEFIPGYYRVNMANVADPTVVRIQAVDDEASNDSKGLVLVESAQLCCQRTEPPVPPTPGPVPPDGGIY